MADLLLKIAAAEPVLHWLSEGFDNNWSSNLQEPYAMLHVDYDVAMELPDDVMAWAYRRQRKPMSEPEFTLPAGILAKYALGEPIPKTEE